MEMNVEHVGVYAKDPDGLASWYRAMLGLREVRRIGREGHPSVVFLQGDGGAVIEFLPTSESVVERDLRCPGYTHLGIPVVDMQKERTRLAELGVEMWGIRETSNGWTIGYLHDPEGNILELIQRSSKE
jgi:catechol 2,3-dioxygenase-like lactoylglutathione lyase family enzyme